MTTPQVTPFTTTPSRQNPSTFSADRDTRLAEEASRITEQNAMATWMNNTATDVSTDAGTASEQVGLAMTQAENAAHSASDALGYKNLAFGYKDAAAASAATALSAPGTSATSTTPLTVGTGSQTMTIQTGKSLVVGMSTKIAYTTTPTTWMFGDITAYDSVSGSLTVNVTAINGSGTQALWTVSISGIQGAAGTKLIIRSARTSNTILNVTDCGTLIDITANSFTQTFTAAATLGDGWFCYLHNSGTGDITLDPDGSEQIDGKTSYIMYPGECRLVQCDGAALTSVVITPFCRTITTTLNSFITPPGYKELGGLLWGGGGSGAKYSDGASGGGGGACVPFVLTAAQMGISQIITIASGGVAVTVNNTNGNVGGNSTIGSLVTAYGGGYGFPNGASGANGGGCFSAADINTPGRPYTYIAISDNNLFDNTGFGGAWGGQAATNGLAAGGNSVYGGAGSGAVYNSYPRISGNSIYGGAAGGTVYNTIANPGGTSNFGGNGGTSNTTISGVAGSQPGGGGGGTATGTSSGAGGDGQCIIWGIV